MWPLGAPPGNLEVALGSGAIDLKKSHVCVEGHESMRR
jgi:hypothetical protein